ncbi:hypothetical protein HYH02_010416 [Chlamydomonas schloesseri]|uniref:S-acyltransferase n=1 Tax=Chlamydomonas schloesseri TaxID=2026947 RepID=A0A835TC72_9CHLO|nr:hypothetical protein HYH02_010416 [Chlamydomonas schloesseri]|eukprot:KAG2440538.1 hypothetical protein HYH02_010416 [Chlamydomonas schloesseri]
MPFVEDAGARWFLVALYSLLVIAIVALDLYTSYLDPSDPGLMGATDGEFFCGLCQASVARSSKHCRACDRCVEGFDHHCKWLNNCVGAKNYWHFFALISSTVSLLTLQLAWGLWLFITSFTQKSEMRGRVADKYGSSVAYGGWQAALALYMAMLIAAVIMLGELFFFHVVLISKGMTTYDYIVAQRDAKLAAPPPSSGAGAAAGHAHGCRSSRVADQSTAKRKVRVGINPCAAIKTHKPTGNPAEYGKAAGAGAAAAGNGAAAGLHAGGGGSGKGLGGAVGNGSLKGSLGISDKVGAGTMQEMVARAVAEQQHHPAKGGLGGGDGNVDSTLISALQGGGGAGGAGGLREPALLGAAAPPGTVPVQGCVPECTGEPHGSGGGGAGGGMDSARQDFTSLANQSPQLAPSACHHRHHHHQSPGQPGTGQGSHAAAAAAQGSPARSPGQLALGVSNTPPGSSGPAPAPGSSNGAAPTGSFDAAFPAALGRHLGGQAAAAAVPAGSPAAAGRVASTAPPPPAAGGSPALGMPPASARVAPLPPIRLPSGSGSVLVSPPPASTAQRSLMFPTKTPSGNGRVAVEVGAVGGSRGQVAVMPE